MLVAAGRREVSTPSGMIQMLVGEAVGETTENGEELRFAYRGAAAGR